MPKYYQKIKNYKVVLLITMILKNDESLLCDYLKPLIPYLFFCSVWASVA